MKTSLSFALRFAVLGGLFVFASCTKDTPIAALVIPSSYDTTNFVANSATQNRVVTQLNDLITEVKRGRIVTNKLNKTTLDGLYTAGTPSLSTVVNPYLKAKLEGTNGWFDEIAKASGNTYMPAAPTANSQGGVYGSGTSAYLFDENGLEIEQLIEKGLFGATLYKHATDLFDGSITIATPDQLIAIFGGTQYFANSGSSVPVLKKRDRAMANYASRRDKNDGKGYYSQLKTQFTKLQAAIKAGTNYNKDRDEAIAEIKMIWEKVNAATTINYCHAVIAALSASNPTDNQKSAALHAYGECVGFIYGWKTIPQKHKKITDAQIDEVLVLLNAPANGTPTSYKFVTDPLNELPKLTQIIDKLKTIYGFSTQEIEDFKNNWLSVQAR